MMRFLQESGLWGRLAGVLVLLSAVSCRQALPTLDLELCVNANGTATPTWTEGIAVALGPEAAKAFQEERHPLTPEAQAWLEVLEEVLPRVAHRALELASLFDLDAFNVTIAAGNRGSSDAFGWVPDHIGVNLQAFVDTYGPPDDAAGDRMTRILAHEYIHLLTYAFYPDHRRYRETPMNRALWTIFFEGIGDYISVSRKWLPTEDGGYSAVATETLARLEPIFVQRLEAFVNARDEQERELRRGIAMGKFDQKWGSLPLALRHLAPELRARLERLPTS